MSLMVCVTENLTADPATTMQPRIDRYRDSVERFAGIKTVQVNVPLATPVADMVELARSNGTEPVQLFGRCPVAIVWNGEDGHNVRPGSMDSVLAVNADDVSSLHDDGSYSLKWGIKLSRAVGRADFSGLPEGAELQLMAAWMDWLDMVKRGTYRPPKRGILNCELDYLFNGIGANLVSIMEGMVGVGNVLDTRGRFAFKQFFQTKAFQGDWLVGAMYDGAEPFGIGEYNTGGFTDFASGLARMLLCLVFCSDGWHPEDWHLMRDLLVGGTCAAVYGTAAPPALTTWRGKTGIGQALVDSWSWHTVTGDVMLLLPDAAGGGDKMTQADIDNTIAAQDAKYQLQFAGLDARLKIVEQATGSNSVNAGGTVIGAAIWRSPGQPGAADALKYVKEMVAAGRPVVATNAAMGAYYGMSERAFDPAFGFQKTLHIEGVRGGAAFSDDLIEGSSKLVA